MLMPLSWLKEFVDIKLPIEELVLRLSEAGLSVEKHTRDGQDYILDLEITPNRPDWMSVYGVAREIAAITNSKLKNQKAKIQFKTQNLLDIKIKPNYEIVPRITSVIIRNVNVKPSPEWLSHRIKQIGLRPINNLVDITNYVLWTYGSLLHAFDYDKIRGHQMVVELSRGGEAFRSLDGIDYTLPKNAIVIKDVGRVIDLLPLKGGENTATSAQTKNVLLHSVVCDPVLTRRTSQALGLRSDSSAIAERGLDPNGTLTALTIALSLILEIAGGEVACPVIDHKAAEFKPGTVEMSHSRLEAVLGVTISPKEVKDILERLILGVEGQYRVTVPTFRSDLTVEEDLIEEVARIYGYNNFPKTLPLSAVPTTPVAYRRDYDFEYEVKQLLVAGGICEIYTYSLISQDQLIKLDLDPSKIIRVDNPVSVEFEYLRPHLIGNLLEALKANQGNLGDIKLFELGKTYQGETIDKIEESYRLGAIFSGERFFEAKGAVESLAKAVGLGIRIGPPEKGVRTDWFHPGRVAWVYTAKEKLGTIGEVNPKILSRFGIKTRAVAFVLKYELLEKLARETKKYQPVPKYPAQIEDLSLVIPRKVLFGDVVTMIRKASQLVAGVELLDKHENRTTVRIIYRHSEKNLTDQEVGKARRGILTKLKRLGVKAKDKNS